MWQLSLFIGRSKFVQRVFFSCCWHKISSCKTNSTCVMVNALAWFPIFYESTRKYRWFQWAVVVARGYGNNYKMLVSFFSSIVQYLSFFHTNVNYEPVLIFREIIIIIIDFLCLHFSFIRCHSLIFLIIIGFITNFSTLKMM